jgi:hypothetical protein
MLWTLLGILAVAAIVVGLITLRADGAGGEREQNALVVITIISIGDIARRARAAVARCSCHP